MAARGRKPMGPQLVEHLDGSERAKQRMEVILETIAGKLTIGQACHHLGISEARFHQLRTEVLQAGLAQLEPRPLGRPLRERSPETMTIAALEQQLADLQLELKTTDIRLQIAQAMPHLLKAEASVKKGLPRKKKTRSRSKRPAETNR